MWKPRFLVQNQGLAIFVHFPRSKPRFGQKSSKPSLQNSKTRFIKEETFETQVTQIAWLSVMSLKICCVDSFTFELILIWIRERGASTFNLVPRLIFQSLFNLWYFTNIMFQAHMLFKYSSWDPKKIGSNHWDESERWYEMFLVRCLKKLNVVSWRNSTTGILRRLKTSTPTTILQLEMDFTVTEIANKSLLLDTKPTAILFTDSRKQKTCRWGRNILRYPTLICL